MRNKHPNCLEAAAVGDEFVPRGLGKPTDAWPGSSAKVQVLCHRLNCGVELWHPADRNSLGRHGLARLTAEMRDTPTVEETLPRRERTIRPRRMFDLIKRELRDNPGLTATELALRMSVGLQFVREILHEMLLYGMVQKGPERRCTIKQAKQATWFAY